MTFQGNEEGVAPNPNEYHRTEVHRRARALRRRRRALGSGIWVSRGCRWRCGSCTNHWYKRGNADGLCAGKSYGQCAAFAVGVIHYSISADKSHNDIDAPRKYSNHSSLDLNPSGRWDHTLHSRHDTNHWRINKRRWGKRWSERDPDVQ